MPSSVDPSVWQDVYKPMIAGRQLCIRFTLDTPGDLLLISFKEQRVRIYHTTERENLHTDSCDIVALLCLEAAKRGGLSSLTSSMTVYNVVAACRPDLLRRLLIPFATDRRGESPTASCPG